MTWCAKSCDRHLEIMLSWLQQMMGELMALWREANL